MPSFFLTTVTSDGDARGDRSKVGGIRRRSSSGRGHCSGRSHSRRHPRRQHLPQQLPDRPIEPGVRKRRRSSYTRSTPAPWSRLRWQSGSSNSFSWICSSGLSLLFRASDVPRRPRINPTTFASTPCESTKQSTRDPWRHSNTLQPCMITAPKLQSAIRGIVAAAGTPPAG